MNKITNYKKRKFSVLPTGEFYKEYDEVYYSDNEWIVNYNINNIKYLKERIDAVIGAASSKVEDDSNSNPTEGINPWKNQIDENAADIADIKSGDFDFPQITLNGDTITVWPSGGTGASTSSEVIDDSDTNPENGINPKLLEIENKLDRSLLEDSLNQKGEFGYTENGSPFIRKTDLTTSDDAELRILSDSINLIHSNGDVLMPISDSAAVPKLYLDDALNEINNNINQNTSDIGDIIDGTIPIDSLSSTTSDDSAANPDDGINPWKKLIDQNTSDIGDIEDGNVDYPQLILNGVTITTWPPGGDGASASSQVSDDSDTNPESGINPWKTQLDINTSQISNKVNISTTDANNINTIINTDGCFSAVVKNNDTNKTIHLYVDSTTANLKDEGGLPFIPTNPEDIITKKYLDDHGGGGVSNSSEITNDSDTNPENGINPKLLEIDNKVDIKHIGETYTSQLKYDNAGSIEIDVWETVDDTNYTNYFFNQGQLTKLTYINKVLIDLLPIDKNDLTTKYYVDQEVLNLQNQIDDCCNTPTPGELLPYSDSPTTTGTTSELVTNYNIIVNQNSYNDGTNDVKDFSLTKGTDSSLLDDGHILSMKVNGDSDNRSNQIINYSPDYQTFTVTPLNGDSTYSGINSINGYNATFTTLVPDGEYTWKNGANPFILPQSYLDFNLLYIKVNLFGSKADNNGPEWFVMDTKFLSENGGVINIDDYYENTLTFHTDDPTLMDMLFPNGPPYNLFCGMEGFNVNLSEAITTGLNNYQFLLINGIYKSGCYTAIIETKNAKFDGTTKYNINVNTDYIVLNSDGTYTPTITNTADYQLIEIKGINPLTQKIKNCKINKRDEEINLLKEENKLLNKKYDEMKKTINKIIEKVNG